MKKSEEDNNNSFKEKNNNENNSIKKNNNNIDFNYKRYNCRLIIIYIFNYKQGFLW